MAANSRNSAKSTLPNNVPLTLPPLEPAPTKAKNAPAPIVYTVRLSNEVATAIRDNPDSTIRFLDNDDGVISVPNFRNINFTARPTTDPNNETARAACYSHRGQGLRHVGPVVAEMLLEWNNINKKRPREPSTPANKADPKQPTDSQPLLKRQRDRKQTPVEKRPRKPLIPASQPLPNRPNSLTSSKLSLTSKLPSKPNSPPTLPHRPNPRSAPLSPAVSPPPLRSAPHPQPPTSSLRLRSALSPYSSANPPAAPSASAHNGGPASSRRPSTGLSSLGTPPTYTPPGTNGITKRRTPTRSSLSAMKPIKNSPVTIGANPLPRPGPRPRPNRQQHRNTAYAVSPMDGRGQSPGNGARSMYSAYTSPRSPMVAKPISNEARSELRRDVLHVLAAGERGLESLRKRLGITEGCDLQPAFSGVLREVAVKRDGVFSLRDSLWPEVADNYAGYSDVERSGMRIRRSSVMGAGVGSDDIGSGRGMSDEDVDVHMKEFERLDSVKHGQRLCKEADSEDLRKQYKKWYPVYAKIIGKLEELSTLFAQMEKRYLDSHGSKEREEVVKRIQKLHRQYRERKDRLENSLPKMHNFLKAIQTTLKERASPRRYNGGR